jgi:hypothetical protein
MWSSARFSFIRGLAFGKEEEFELPFLRQQKDSCNFLGCSSLTRSSDARYLEHRMKKQTSTVQTSTTTQSPAAQAQETSIDTLVRDWAELKKLEEKKSEIETAMQGIRNRINPLYRHLGRMLGVEITPKTTRRNSTPRTNRTAGGSTQFETAKTIVSVMANQFSIDDFRSGMKEQNLEANVHNILGKLKSANVIMPVAGERGVFKKV